MLRSAIISPMALALASGVAGCEEQPKPASAPEYQGAVTAVLDNSLVSIRVQMVGAKGREDVVRYAECAAAQYTLTRGYGFARHLRTKVSQKAGQWQGDAVYTISPALPRGLKTMDAEVVAAACAENGIPTV